jgi:hypothetical protein
MTSGSDEGMRMNGRILTVLAMLTTLAAGSVFAQPQQDASEPGAKQAIKHDAKAVGHGVADGARHVGHATRDVATQVGHGAKDAGKGIGHGAKKAGVAVGHGAREGWDATRRGFKKAIGKDD